MFTDFILSSWHQIQIVSCSVGSLCCVKSVNIRDWDVVISVVTGLDGTQGQFRLGADIEQWAVAGRGSVTGQFTRMTHVRV